MEALTHCLRTIKEGEETAATAAATSTTRDGNESDSGISVGSRPLTWAWLNNAEEGSRKQHQAQSRGLPARSDAHQEGLSRAQDLMVQTVAKVTITTSAMIALTGMPGGRETARLDGAVWISIAPSTKSARLCRKTRHHRRLRSRGL